MAKSRLIPLKEKADLKIPKLKLLAAVIGSRLTSYVSKTLSLKITDQILWSDSEIVLSWLETDKLLPPFISRRILEIKNNTNLKFRYVPSNKNPADIATRPELASMNQKINTWENGPLFLQNNESMWPQKQKLHINIEQNLLAWEGPTRKTKLKTRQTKQTNEHDQIFRDINNESKICDKEIETIKQVQREHFLEELANKRTSLSKSLGLFIDEKGIIRFKGRLQNSILPYDQKFPVLLPKNSEYTENIIKNINSKNYHVGVSHSLAIIRNKY